MHCPPKGLGINVLGRAKIALDKVEQSDNSWGEKSGLNLDSVLLKQRREAFF